MSMPWYHSVESASTDTRNETALVTAIIKHEPGFDPEAYYKPLSMLTAMEIPFPKRYNSVEGESSRKRTTFSSESLIKDGDIGPATGYEHLYTHASIDSKELCKMNRQQTLAIDHGLFYLGCDLLLSSSDSDEISHILDDLGCSPATIGTVVLLYCTVQTKMSNRHYQTLKVIIQQQRESDKREKRNIEKLMILFVNMLQRVEW